MRYVKTNIGTLPIEDYREIMTVQNGFDSYEELRKQDYHLAVDETEDDPPHERKGEIMDFEIRPATKAERMKQCGNTVEPLEGLMVPNKKARDRGDAR